LKTEKSKEIPMNEIKKPRILGLFFVQCSFHTLGSSFHTLGFSFHTLGFSTFQQVLQSLQDYQAVPDLGGQGQQDKTTSSRVQAYRPPAEAEGFHGQPDSQTPLKPIQPQTLGYHPAPTPPQTRYRAVLRRFDAKVMSVAILRKISQPGAV
jgi:hypothetical protein